MNVGEVVERDDGRWVVTGETCENGVMIREGSLAHDVWLEAQEPAPERAA